MLLDGEKSLMICLLVSTQYTNVTDTRQTDGHRTTLLIAMARLQSRGNNMHSTTLRFNGTNTGFGKGETSAFYDVVLALDRLRAIS